VNAVFRAASPIDTQPIGHPQVPGTAICFEFLALDLEAARLGGMAGTAITDREALDDFIVLIHAHPKVGERDLNSTRRPNRLCHPLHKGSRFLVTLQDLLAERGLGQRLVQVITGKLFLGQMAVRLAQHRSRVTESRRALVYIGQQEDGLGPVLLQVSLDGGSI